MTAHAELRGFWHLYRMLRHRHAQAADDLGFGYSRSDTESDATRPAAVPDGIDLYFFTGRTRTEATR